MQEALRPLHHDPLGQVHQELECQEHQNEGDDQAEDGILAE